MGFYGSISNAGKTQINFDKIYPRRSQMELHCASDGVFIGRRVLVEYDDNTYSYRMGYIKESPKLETDAFVYLDSKCTIPYTTQPNNDQGFGLMEGDIIRVQYGGQYFFFRHMGRDSVEQYALFQLAMSQSEIYHTDDLSILSDYTVNYYLDRKWAKENNIPFTIGWDSTVWEKTIENGKEKYKMVATLSSVTPRFSVAADPPCIDPMPPHFGTHSTNLDYILHVPSQWGFRVAEAASPSLSDEKVKYDFIQYNPETGKDEWINDSYDGAIYYNRAGFSPEKISYSTVPNNISILPTGKSGKKYVSHFSDDYLEEKIDTQEITIQLPEFGNIAAQMWDIVYGDQEMNGGKLKRNTNIEWNSLKGLRMVEEDTEGSGFIYTPEKVETLAGCINSVHDLMGMIVSESVPGQTPEEALDLAHIDRIYHGKYGSTEKKGYFYKNKTYKYLTLEEKQELDPTFDPDGYVGSRKYYDLTQFLPGEYWTFIDGSYYCDYSELPIEDALYYKIGTPIPIKLQPWQPPSEEDEDEVIYNYYKDEEANCVRDTNTFATPGRQYFDIKAEAVTNPIQTDPGTIRVWSPTAPVCITEEVVPEEIVDVTELQDNKIDDFYQGYFKLIKDEDGNPSSFVALKPGDAFDDKAEYFYFPIYARATGQDEDGVENISVFFIKDKKLIAFTQGVLNRDLYSDYKITYLAFEGKTYYSAHLPTEKEPWEGYERLKSIEDVDNTKVYYTIEFTPSNGKFVAEEEETPDDPLHRLEFYAPDTYYYYTETKDMVLAIEDDFNPEEEYYLLTDKNNVQVQKNPDTGLYEIEPEKVLFYRPGRYYYRSISLDGDILDNSYEMKTPEYEDVDQDYVVDGMVYYIPNQLYVINDTAGILSKGYKWDKNTEPPQSVTLGMREEVYEWVELEGFARTLNTIHGLILQVNKFFQFNNSLTRDSSTIQGCLNQIKDIVHSFNDLNPGDTVLVDEYGRLVGLKHTSDDWIDIDLNTAVNAASLKISHADPQSNIEPAKIEDEVLSFGDTFVTHEFNFDAKGHLQPTSVVQKNITLPNIDDVIKTDTEFDYTYNEETVQYTIATLVSHIASLEGRIKTLEDNFDSMKERLEALENPTSES